MPADRIHLIRHGEVHNPDGVIYGRLPHFHLSPNGHQMAAAAAADLRDRKIKLEAIFASPLLRTRESAEHVQELYGIEPVTDERLIEPFNIFEGKKVSAKAIALRPHLVYHLRNPLTPSWGESYVAIVARMMAAIHDIAKSVPDGDVAIVSHQLPIWMVHRHLSGARLVHNPNKRRCALSSITSIERNAEGEWVEIDYRDPAAKISARDKGAV